MQAATWSAHVAATQAAKLHHAPPAPAADLARARATAVTRAKGFGRGTVFDPLLGAWADPAAEAAVRAAADASALARGNAARDRQLLHEQTFDVVNARPRVAEPPARGPRETTETFSSRVPYNVLTGAPLPDALLTARARVAPLAARAQAEPPRPLTNAAPSLVRRRGIDIISNLYAVDHEARAAAEAAAVRERALRRFWQTRNFDPVRQVFEDGAKDAAYEEGARLAARVAGVAQRERLPSSLRFALGAAYDIVAHAPREPAVVDLIDTMASRPLRRMHARAVEARLAAEGEAAADAAEARRLRAMRATARQQALGDPGGFDITTSLPRDPARLRATLAGGREPSAWDRIQAGLGEGGGAGAWGGGGGGGGGGGAGGIAGFGGSFGAEPTPRGRVGASSRPAPLPPAVPPLALPAGEC